MFEDIHSAGQRMLALVNDLLEVSKLESTVGTFHLERIDLRGLIQPVVKELEPLLARSQQTMHLRLSELPLVAKVDPLRLQQVIRNVVANAIKFSPPGSSITVVGRMDSEGRSIWRCMTKALVCPKLSWSRSLKPSCSPAKPKMVQAAPGWGWLSAARSSKPWEARYLRATSRPKGPRSTSCCQHAVLQRPSRLLCECIRGAVSATVSWGRKKPTDWLAFVLRGLA